MRTSYRELKNSWTRNEVSQYLSGELDLCSIEYYIPPSSPAVQYRSVLFVSEFSRGIIEYETSELTYVSTQRQAFSDIQSLLVDEPVDGNYTTE